MVVYQTGSGTQTNMNVNEVRFDGVQSWGRAADELPGGHRSSPIVLSRCSVENSEAKLPFTPTTTSTCPSLPTTRRHLQSFCDIVGKLTLPAWFQLPYRHARFRRRRDFQLSPSFPTKTPRRHARQGARIQPHYQDWPNSSPGASPCFPAPFSRGADPAQ